MANFFGQGIVNFFSSYVLNYYMPRLCTDILYNTSIWLLTKPFPMSKIKTFAKPLRSLWSLFLCFYVSCKNNYPKFKNSKTAFRTTLICDTHCICIYIQIKQEVSLVMIGGSVRKLLQSLPNQKREELFSKSIIKYFYEIKIVWPLTLDAMENMKKKN